MQPTAPDSVLGQLHWRYATKKFDPARKIEPDVWRNLEQSLVLSPSSYGLQPWRFVVVTNPEVRAKLRAVAWNQSQVTDASHLVVLAHRKGFGPADVDRLIARTAEVRHLPAEALDGYKNMMLGFANRLSAEHLDAWCARQTYIALGFFLSTAAVLGIDACPMEGFEPAKFNEILGLDAQGYSAVVLAAAGYRSAEDTSAGNPKVRFPVEETVRHIA